MKDPIILTFTTLLIQGAYTLLIFAAGYVAGWALHRQTKTERKLVSSLESLTAAIARLQHSVDAAVTDINTPHPTDAQAQAAADAVNAQCDRLDASVTPAP